MVADVVEHVSASGVLYRRKEVGCDRLGIKAALKFNETRLFVLADGTPVWMLLKGLHLIEAQLSLAKWARADREPLTWNNDNREGHRA
jgi:hypothetical protein